MNMAGMRGPTKLADVLKRSGLAASVGDAKRIASDISTTERKVQTYFDEKKSQMQEDLANKRFGQNSQVLDSPIQSDQSTQSSTQEIALENNTLDTAPQMEIKQEMEIEKEAPKKNASLHELEEVQSEVRRHLENNNMMPKFEKEVKSDACLNCSNKIDQAPVLNEISAEEKEEEHVSLSDMFKEEDKGQEFIYSKLEEQNHIPNTDQVQLNDFTTHETISRPVETKNETNETIMKPIETKMEVIEEKPVKPVQENKMEVIEEEPLEPKYKENAISQEVPAEPVPEEKKMDTSEEQSVDLTQMFNFGSRSSSPAPTPEPVQESKPAAEEKPISQDKKGQLGISTNDSNDHPKTGNSASIDINEMFNFAKRGKL